MTTMEPQYFFIIGAMKAGTTSLFKYLSGHPDLCPSSRKEPRVFRRAGEATSLRAELSALFAARRDERWCYEASTAYTKFPRIPGVPRRLQAVVPEARFIYLVRNPVERVWSQYVHDLWNGRETRPLTEAIAKRPQLLHTSRYHLQLEQYDVFPQDRILVLVFEEMIKDPAGTVRTICEFLGVDPAYRPSTGDIAYNASSDKRTAPLAIRATGNLGVAEMLPWRVRYWLRSRGTPLPSKKDRLPPALRLELVEALRPDTEAFFLRFGRRISAWSDFA